MPKTKSRTRRLRTPVSILKELHPIASALRAQKVVGHDKEQMLRNQLRHHISLEQWRMGRATKSDMVVLLGMGNLTHALCHMGFGPELADEIKAGQLALCASIQRCLAGGPCVATDEEFRQVHNLFLIYEAQMEVATQQDLLRAAQMEIAAIANGTAVVLNAIN